MEIISELVNRGMPSGICIKKFTKLLFLLSVAGCLGTYACCEMPVYSAIVHEESRSSGLFCPAEGIIGSVNSMTGDHLLDTVKTYTLPEVSETRMMDIAGKVPVEKIDIDERADHSKEGYISPDHIAIDHGAADDSVADSAGTEDITLDEGVTDVIDPIENDGFLCNESGYITGYTDAGLVLKDGLLILPSDPSCKGVAKGAFAGLEDAMELYIPANICYIEAGAFEELNNLFFIEAAPDSRTFYSENGILYYRDGSAAVCPPGR